MDRTEQAKKWGKRIESARIAHKREMCDWADKVISEYAGDMKNDRDTGERYDTIAQVIHSVEETVQPSLFIAAPKVMVKANKPEWEKREPLVEAVMNHEYRAILPDGRRLELENELALIDARLLPYGGTKTTYQVEGEILEEPQDLGMIDKVKTFFTGDKPTIQMPVITKEKGHVTERFDPFKVMIDPNCKHISKTPYVIEELDLKEDELKNPRYDQQLVQKLKPDVCMDSTLKLEGKNLDNYFRDNKDLEGYRLYEIHDLKERVIHTYSEQLKDFVEFGSPYPVEEGSQYSFLWFIEAPNRAYPLPPIKFYRRRAIEYSYIYTQLARQIDKFMPKIGVDSTKLGPADKERLKVGELATVFETVGPPANAVQQFTFSIQKELFTYLQTIQNLMNLESGVNDYEIANPETDRTATEATYMKQGTAIRRMKPKKRMKEFLINQANVIFQTLWKNQTEEKFVKILGEDQALEWWNDPETGKAGWTGEMIAGDYSFDMDIDQVSPVNEALRKKQNMEGMTVVMNPALNQGLMAEGKRLKLSTVVEKFAKDNLGIVDKDSIIEDLNIRTPEQEHDIWMQGKVPPIQKGENHEEHLQKHTAWLGSEGAGFLPEPSKAIMANHIQQTAMVLQQKQMKASPRPKTLTENEPNETALQTEAMKV